MRMADQSECTTCDDAEKSELRRCAAGTKSGSSRRRKMQSRVQEDELVQREKRRLARTGLGLVSSLDRSVRRMCLAHQDGRSSRSIYNKAEYAEQWRHMLREWADMVDAWIDGPTHMPKLMPE